MLDLRALAGILFKPKETAEELNGVATAKEGFALYGFMTLIGFLFFAGASKGKHLDIIPINFGLGAAVGVSSMVFAFFLGLTGFLIVAVIANTVAKHYTQNDRLDSILGLFGYARVLVIPRAIVAGIVALLMYARIQNAIVISPDAVSSAFSLVTVAVTIGLVLSAWEAWIQVRAIQATHELTLGKSVLVIAISRFAWRILILGGGFLL